MSISPQSALTDEERAALYKRLGTKTADGVRALWRGCRQRMYSEQTFLRRLPRWTATFSFSFYETDEEAVLTALKRGDVAFFVMFQLRIDQIDCEAVRAGLTLADRQPIIQTRAVLDGLRRVAETRLEAMGGAFPPKPPDPTPLDPAPKAG